jgi:catechol 2,3-dioxygenase-like lactoylglutathione lyase family enzyme
MNRHRAERSAPAHSLRPSRAPSNGDRLRADIITASERTASRRASTRSSRTRVSSRDTTFYNPEVPVLSNSPVSATLPFHGLKSAREFYSKKLGLKLLAGSVKDCFMAFGAGQKTQILLFESDSKKSGDTGATFEVDNLAREMARLRKKGVKFEKYDLPGVKTVNGVAQMGDHTMAWIKDPGGNIIGLHERE